MQAVGRLGKPNIIAAQLGAARPVKSIIPAVDLLLKDCAVFVMWREDHSLVLKVTKIFGNHKAYSHGYG
jgi:hypothetical protein